MIVLLGIWHYAGRVQKTQGVPCRFVRTPRNISVKGVFYSPDFLTAVAICDNPNNRFFEDIVSSNRLSTQSKCLISKFGE